MEKLVSNFQPWGRLIFQQAVMIGTDSQGQLWQLCVEHAFEISSVLETPR